MVKLNNQHRPQSRSADEVMEEVSERLPHLVQFMFMDRDWIWYCGPALSGDENKETRKVLGREGIGFRFAPAGHTMPDGKTIGTWSHSCVKPAYPRRNKQQKRSRVESGVDLLTSLFTEE